MRVKLLVVAMFWGIFVVVGFASLTQATLITDTKNGVTVQSWVNDNLSEYDYYYKITNNSGYFMDEFQVYLNDGTLVFYAHYFGPGLTIDKLPNGSSAILNLRLGQFNPPQPTAQYAIGVFTEDPWNTEHIEVNAPILLSLHSAWELVGVPEPISIALLVPGLLGLIVLRRRLIN